MTSTTNRIGKGKEFPEGDHFGVLLKVSGDYNTKFEYLAFSSRKDFLEYIEQNPRAKLEYIPIIAKKLDIEVEVRITNLDEKKDLDEDLDEELT